MTVAYRPANGSEGLDFEHRFCRRCVKDAATREDPPRWGDGCQIWASALAFGEDEAEYPLELVRDAGDLFSGRCTAFEADPAIPDRPRTFPLPSEVVGAVLGGTLNGDRL